MPSVLPRNSTTILFKSVDSRLGIELSVDLHDRFFDSRSMRQSTIKMGIQITKYFSEAVEIHAGFLQLIAHVMEDGGEFCSGYIGHFDLPCQINRA